MNLFPLLFNAYLGTDLPLQPDATYAYGPHGLFDLREVANPDADPRS